LFNEHAQRESLDKRLICEAVTVVVATTQVEIETNTLERLANAIKMEPMLH